MAANTQTAKLQFLNEAGIDIVQSIGIGGNVQYSINANGGIQYVTQLLAANAAINPRLPGFYVVTKGSAIALTLAAPTVTTDDGLEIEITLGTNFAHVITATGLLMVAGSGAAQNSLTAVTTGTAIGTTVYLTAYQGKWFVANGGFGTWTVA